MGERRKARRYEVYLPVQVCLAKRRPADFHTGQLRDVSRSGIFFHSHVPLDPGTHVELSEDNKTQTCHPCPWGTFSGPSADECEECNEINQLEG